MEEKKYLKWYNKIGYGSGDIAGNVVYAFLTSFMMVYLTDSVGLAAGVVGTLIAVSKLFDGFTDIFFGSMIDKTHSKMGKAKPWMLYGYIGCAITLVCCFAVPVSLGTTAKYAWFFISYTLLNGVFYTANNIAWNTDNSRSFCPSFRSWRISPTAPHISNVSDLPYAASPFYCAAFFVKEQGAVLRYGTEKGEAFQYRVALFSPKCEDCPH